MPLKKKKINTEKSTIPYVVAIGASAGGLESINTLFENTPSDTGMTFILIQHLSPDHKSLMTELLAKHTEMNVFEAQDGTVIKPNCIYLLPSRKFMTISNGRLLLKDKVKSNLPNNAIDIFFESLAEECRERAVGVILSGTGSDGTKGLDLIKSKGGIVVVQDPLTASFDGMPNSAIQAGNADLILSPEYLMPELMEYLKESIAFRQFHFNNSRDEYTLRDILLLIRRETGNDFYYYKRPTLLRRLSKRMIELNIKQVRDYLNYLHHHTEEIRLISQQFLINVTYFFRDKQAYDALRNIVIPDITKGKETSNTLKIWSIGCSSGEEPYSLAILLHEYLTKKKMLDVQVKIFATDIDRDALEKASRGVYHKNALREMPPLVIARYFTEEGENYRVNPEIRKMIVFSYHDILKDPPFSRMDLVSCRNMLIYINAEAQKEILRKIHFAVNIDGYLFLGPSEHLGQTSAYMQEVDKKWKIYRNVSKARSADDTLFQSQDKSTYAYIQKQKVKNPLSHISDLFQATLLEEYNFAGIFVDPNLEVKQVTGNFKNYISLPDNGFNFQIMKLVPPDLGIALNVALRKALKDNLPVTMKRIRASYGKKDKYINITVKPFLQQKEYQHPFLFVILHEAQAPLDKETRNTQRDLAPHERVEELELELRETKENLQAVIEEIEAANEELQSTNEEIVSTNEELQSTNEELQSLNEELHTVSGEHQMKIKELLDLNDDLNNFFSNSDIGQLFVDSNLIIRKFSPPVRKMVNLLDTDINRSITDIHINFGEVDFLADIRRVIASKQRLEREIVRNNEYVLMRISPYLRQDQKNDGVVVSFINITETRQLNSMLTAVLNSSPSRISAMKAVRNSRGRIIDFEYMVANQTLEKDLQIKPGTITGKFSKEISPDDEHFELYKKVVDKNEHYHFEHFSEKNHKWYEIVLEKLMDGVVCISTDITEKKMAADLIEQSYTDLKLTSQKLKKTNLKLEQSNMDLLQFASVASHDLKEPLRKIQTFGNLLQQKVTDRLNEQEHAYLLKMIQSSARMQRLIEDVLTLSKLSNTSLAFEPVDLNAVLKLIREDLDLNVKEKKARIKIEKLPTIHGIPGQMHQVFQNLLGNALKFTNGRPPQVRISLKEVNPDHAKQLRIKVNNYHCISIKDNGIGFEDTYKEKIFGIFQRLNGSTYDGTGIGLAICKKIVENHSGYILAESKIHKGSEFFIYLPKGRNRKSLRV
jgi:two-component system, chemotaxis family, CheB/CheR fusion protein